MNLREIGTLLLIALTVIALIVIVGGWIVYCGPYLFQPVIQAPLICIPSGK